MSERPNTNFVFYDERLNQVDESYSPAFEESRASVNEQFSLGMMIATELGVDKPEWFRTAEQKVRRFYSQLGFELAPIVLVREGSLLDELDLRDPPHALAHAHVVAGIVFARAENMAKHYEAYGSEGVEVTIAHEGAHLTADYTDTFTAIASPDASEATTWYRSSWFLISDTALDTTLRGLFYEEGFATLLEGMYRRYRANHRISLLSIGEVPSRALPRQYVWKDKAGRVNQVRTAGPDGYAMELLAWAAAKRSIMSQEEFVGNLFLTRRPETMVPALRRFAQVVEAIEPGLYRRLRDVPYSKKDWQTAYRWVYEAVIRSQEPTEQ